MDNISKLHQLQQEADKSADPKAWYECAKLSYNLGESNNALYFLQKILHSKPNDLDAMILVAEIYKGLDKLVAFEMYEELHSLQPKNPLFLQSLIILTQQIQLFEKSIEYIEKYFKVRNPSPELYYTLGVSYFNLKNFYKSEQFYKKALQMMPNDIKTIVGLAAVYDINGKSKTAINMLKNHLDDKDAYFMYTDILLSQRDFDTVREGYFNKQSYFKSETEIIEHIQKVYYLYKVNDIYSVSLDQFMNDKLAKELKDRNIKSYLAQKVLRNENITDKTILVYNLHGAGDLLMFSRYIPLLIKKAKQVILRVPNRMIDLFKYNFPDTVIYDESYPVEQIEFDYSTPFMNLIYNLGCNFYNIPCSDSFIKVPESNVLKCNLNVKKKKVGLCWQGNLSIMPYRSMKFNELSSIFSLDNIQYYSLQLDNLNKKELEDNNVIDLTENIKSYLDTASYLKNIDLLITVDTSIAHLAGALGVKTFLLLPYTAEWRWFNDTDKTPWYDSVKIFKQSPSCTWDNVILRVKNELQRTF